MLRPNIVARWPDTIALRPDTGSLWSDAVALWRNTDRPNRFSRPRVIPRYMPDEPDAATDDLAWETLDSGIDYTCPGFDVRVDSVRFPDGSEGEFHSVTEPESVVVLPFTADGDDSGDGDDDLVVIEEWRQAVGRVSRGLPAGSVEPRDSALADAARRELTEETGYVAETVEPLVTVEPLNGIADAVHHYFVARGCRPEGEQDLDHNESIRVGSTTFAALREQVVGGGVRDGRTVLGVLFYDRTREERSLST